MEIIKLTECSQRRKWSYFSGNVSLICFPSDQIHLDSKKMTRWRVTSIRIVIISNEIQPGTRNGFLGNTGARNLRKPRLIKKWTKQVKMVFILTKESID